MNTPPPPSDLRPGVVRSIGPEPGTFKIDAAELREGGDRSGTGRGDAARDGARRGVGRDRRRDARAARASTRSKTTDGNVVRTRSNPRCGAARWTPQTAATMQAVHDRGREQRGTGTAAQIPGIQVAGKTGTAETGTRAAPHAWFIAFAPAEARSTRSRCSSSTAAPQRRRRSHRRPRRGTRSRRRCCARCSGRNRCRLPCESEPHSPVIATGRKIGFRTRCPWSARSFRTDIGSSARSRKAAWPRCISPAIESLDRLVALKALFPEYAREPSFVERFRREAQAAANLNHPNIVAHLRLGPGSRAPTSS